MNFLICDIIFVEFTVLGEVFLDIAVLYIVFNRLDTVKKVFQRIREIKPSRFYVAADAAREGVEGEVEKCNEIREYIKANVDWDCEFKTLFREKNIGCKYGVSTAIDWFFENEEYGIILEDDCFPSKDFFPFAKELLEKYKDDERIMLISGDNFQNGRKWGMGSYYFSKICHIWGWATWRRAWKLFDIEMKAFPEFLRENKIEDVFEHPSIQWYWLKNYYRTYSGKYTSTWDYQWSFSIINNNGLCIVPNVNLIQNIGFDGNSTHTNFNPEEYSIPTGEMKEIIHPISFIPYKKADEYEHKVHYKISLSKIRAFVRKLFSKNKIRL